jgi:ribonuclease-3
MGTTLHALVQDNEDSLRELENKTGYRFKNIELLVTSLIHSSFAFERLDCNTHNEIQEFLGDAVLDLTVGHLIFVRFPRVREGKLTRIRSALVNETGLSGMARDLELGKYLLLGKGEEASSGREKSSILSCAYEAIVGGIFIDGGYDAAEDFSRKFFTPMIDERQKKLILIDGKSSLQEILQEKYNEGPQYVLDSEDGPSHARIFSVSVHFHGRLLGSGRASSKKEAEQQAATQALKSLS